MKNYYKILQLSEDSNLKEVRKRYKSLVLEYHPDVNKSPNSQKEFIEIVEAYEVLKNPVRKRRYDTLLKIHLLKEKENAKRVSNKKIRRFKNKIKKAEQKGFRKGENYSKDSVDQLSKRNDSSIFLEILADILKLILKLFEPFP